MHILVVHGPNLNLLGTRDPAVYGTTTLAEIDAELARRAAARGATVTSVQSNLEGEIVDAIQGARGTADAIVINPGGYTHTSVAIRDAIEAVALPTIAIRWVDWEKRPRTYYRGSRISGASGCAFLATVRTNSRPPL